MKNGSILAPIILELITNWTDDTEKEGLPHRLQGGANCELRASERHDYRHVTIYDKQGTFAMRFQFLFSPLVACQRRTTLGRASL